MKHLFIVNPIAGGKDKTAEVRAKVETAFASRDDEYEIYVTKAPMDAARKIRETAGTAEHMRVYACGGDGTFNECVCGAAGLENVAVCPFPTGTGNDFCRMFGEDKELYRDLEALLNGEERMIDLIDCNGRYSANICSVGIDARIGTEVHKYSRLPLIGGAAGYVVSTVVNVFKGISRHMHVICDGYDHAGEYSVVCVCNGRFYGGGFNPSLRAMPDDGILDIYIVPKVGLLTFAKLIGKYAAGKADEFPELITHLRSDSVEVIFEEENVVNVDGEAIYASDVKMRVFPLAARLVTPAGMKFFRQAESETAAAM